MTRDIGRLRAAMATLLVASALLFGVGILVEQGSGATPGTPGETTTPSEGSPAPHVEASGGEGGEAGEAGESHPASTEPTGAVGGEADEAPGTHEASGSSELILGINPEAPAMVWLAIILSLLAAWFVWRDGRRVVIGAGIAIALAFGALDLLEVRHQLSDGTIVVGGIAAAVAGAHLAAAALGGLILRRSSGA